MSANPRHLRKPKARVSTLVKWFEERATLTGAAILHRNPPNPYFAGPRQKPLKLPRFRGKRYNLRGKR